MSTIRSRSLTAGFARARRRLLVSLAAAFAAVAVLAHPGPAAAQPINQMALTAKQIEGFIAANKEMSALIAKIEKGGKDPTPQQMAGLDGIARKYGFKDFNEYEDVAENISIVLSGIDPQTKQFTQPPDIIRKEIAQVKADKSLSPAERKELLTELSQQLKLAQPVEHAGNIALVLKYYGKLDAMLQ